MLQKIVIVILCLTLIVYFRKLLLLSQSLESGSVSLANIDASAHYFTVEYFVCDYVWLIWSLLAMLKWRQISCSVLVAAMSSRDTQRMSLSSECLKNLARLPENALWNNGLINHVQLPASRFLLEFIPLALDSPSLPRELWYDGCLLYCCIKKKTDLSGSAVFSTSIPCPEFE